MSEDAPKVIFLEPACGHATDERLWCEDDVWGGACDECGAPVYRYKLDAPRPDAGQVEAVARAIFDAAPDDEPAFSERQYRDMARAAIAAMIHQGDATPEQGGTK